MASWASRAAKLANAFDGVRRSVSEQAEQVIASLSPSWAASRKAWKAFGDSLESYRGAVRSRTDYQQGNQFGTADAALLVGYERDRLWERSRELERNNILASSILDRAVENIVGNGFTPQARTSDKEWNRRAEELHATEPIDARGMDSFGELLATVHRSYERDGDVGTHLMDDGRIQIIETDQIADPFDKIGNILFADGVELDTAGRPVRFHIVDEREVDYRSLTQRRALSKRIAIEADKFVFLSRRKRARQTRGEPVFSQSFWIFDQLDGNIEAVTMAARMAACFGLIIERSGGYSGLPTTTGSDGKSYRSWALEPAMIKELEPGDKVSQVNPAQPTQNFGEFVALLSRFVGLPLGMPLELVLMDSSRTNFSSMRGSMLQAQRSFRKKQRMLADHWCAPVWRHRIRKFIEQGKLTDRPDWDKHTWSTPGWPWVNPTDEVNANLAAIDAGFKTVRQVVTEQGLDPDDQIAERAAELKAFATAGIPLLHSSSTRDPVRPKEEAPEPVAKKPEPEDDDDDDEMRAAVESLAERLDAMSASLVDIEVSEVHQDDEERMAGLARSVARTAAEHAVTEHMDRFRSSIIEMEVEEGGEATNG